jgi:thiol-disulfide isomerase/thioredoxin
VLIGSARLLLLVVAMFTAVSSGQSLKIGEPAPQLSLERTIPSGADATWAALRGKPVVIEFWATWCANCVAEIPRLNEMVAKFESIQFISITDEPLSVAEPFLASHPIHGLIGLDHEASTFKAYGVEGRPQTILVDKDGVLRGILHPGQVSAAVLSDLIAGKPIHADSLAARLHILQDTSADPVFALLLRPSNQAKPGGVFAVDAGKLQADNIPLLRIIAYAYATGSRHLEGPQPLLSTHYDFCVLLPDGMTGDTELLRDMLERSFKLKLHHEAREMDAMVLKLRGAKPPEFPGGFPMSVLVNGLEGQLNRMVVDETGLQGRYKSSPIQGKEEDIRQALLSELGIEMILGRRPVDMLIVDSLELPMFRKSLGR